MYFLDTLKQRAIQAQKKIVFPESHDPRVLQAVRRIADEEIALPVLIGNEETIHTLAQQEHMNLQNIEIIDHLHDEHFSNMVESFFQLRKAKGVTLPEAEKILTNPIYYATMLVAQGLVDGLLSGSMSPTADTLRPAFQIIGTSPGVSKVSSFFILAREEDKQILFFADCAVNIDPSAEELAEIAWLTVRSVKNLALPQRVAFLSFFTYDATTATPRQSKVYEASQILRQREPNLIVSSEMQFDAAYVPEVAHLKAPHSIIQGDANIFIFPDLESGNIGYKIAQRLGNFEAIGPVLQGLKKPVNDLSRGCTVQEIVDMTMLTVISETQ